MFSSVTSSGRSPKIGSRLALIISKPPNADHVVLNAEIRRERLGSSRRREEYGEGMEITSHILRAKRSDSERSCSADHAAAQAVTAL